MRKTARFYNLFIPEQQKVVPECNPSKMEKLGQENFSDFWFNFAEKNLQVSISIQKVLITSILILINVWY